MRGSVFDERIEPGGGLWGGLREGEVGVKDEVGSSVDVLNSFISK